MNIIVRMPNWVGDLVMATPVLADLKNHFPNSSITAMCRRPVCELLDRDISIDEIFAFDRPASGFTRREERRDIIGKIEAGSYDVGIFLTNSFSSVWWFWQAGVKRRIGFGGKLWSFLLTDSVKAPKEVEHQVIRYKRLLAPLGIGISKTKPRLYLDLDEIEEAMTLLHRRDYKKGMPLVGINPGAAFGSAKCWLPERFRELTQRLLKQEKVFVVFFGDRSGKSLIQEIVKDLGPRVIDLAGVTSLRELASLISVCTVLVTNDSGPMHIGAALDVPLVALFGSTEDLATGPYGQSESVIHKRVACSPCFKRECPIDFRCMKEIHVDEVLRRVLPYVQDI